MFNIITDGCEPTIGSEDSTCLDLRSAEDVIIKPGKTEMISLGISINVESIIDVLIERSMGMWIEEEYSRQRRFLKKSHYIQMMLRSSLGKKGLIIANGVGVIDLDYKDELKILIHNPMGELVYYQDHTAQDRENFEIKTGDKIAQIALLEHKTWAFGVETTNKRNGGFGSTGEK